jgi:Flp pilus assembly protein TadD
LIKTRTPALVLFSRGRVAEALALFAEAVRLTPGNVRMLTNYAAALAAEGRVQEARGYLQRALTIAPDDREAQRDLARLTGAQQAK